MNCDLSTLDQHADVVSFHRDVDSLECHLLPANLGVCVGGGVALLPDPLLCWASRGEAAASKLHSDPWHEENH